MIHESLGPRHLHTLETSHFCFPHKGVKAIHPLLLRYLSATLTTFCGDSDSIDRFQQKICGNTCVPLKLSYTGEPKSGTTFMYHWAHGALVRSCSFLNTWFGIDSCILKTGRYRGMFHTPEEVSITFDPRLKAADARCPCTGVDRWEFSSRCGHPNIAFFVERPHSSLVWPPRV